MQERVCSKCGGNGPFPPLSKQCKKCIAARKAEWFQKRKTAKGPMPRGRPKLPSEVLQARRQAAIEARRERRKVDSRKREAWNAYHREYRKRRKSLSQEQIGKSFFDPDDGFLAFLMETETD